MLIVPFDFYAALFWCRAGVICSYYFHCVFAVFCFCVYTPQITVLALALLAVQYI